MRPNQVHVNVYSTQPKIQKSSVYIHWTHGINSLKIKQLNNNIDKNVTSQLEAQIGWQPEIPYTPRSITTGHSASFEKLNLNLEKVQNDKISNGKNIWRDCNNTWNPINAPNKIAQPASFA